MSATIETATIDLRPLPRPQRHILVFNRFETLAPGETMEFVNDHDPLGLLHQFSVLLPGQFTWSYLDQGPEQWRVVVGRTQNAIETEHSHEPGCCGGCG